MQLAMTAWDHNPFVLVNYSPTICLNPSPLMGWIPGRSRSVKRRDTMVGPLNRTSKSGQPPSGATRRTALGLILGAPLLGACSSVQQSLGPFSNPFGGSPDAGPAGPQPQPPPAGPRQFKAGLI